MSDIIPNALLIQGLEECPAVGKRFKHWKSEAVYVIVGSALLESSMKPLVIYQNLGNRLTFARPLNEWREKCFVPERKEWVERFKEVM